MFTTAEENYIKAVFNLSYPLGESVSTNSVAAHLETSAASVTDMLRRLSEKDLLHYTKYKGVQLTENGRNLALSLVRRHRLWEFFLTEKLGFAWDQVHDIAEQLEHVSGEGLIERLDTFLGHPKYDPHGDPIPDAEGRLHSRKQMPASEFPIGKKGIVTGVNDHSGAFLQYLARLGLGLGSSFIVVERFDFDHSFSVQIEHASPVNISEKIALNIYISIENEE